MSSSLIGRGRPPRPPTHRAVDFGKLAKLSSELEDAADGGTVDAEAIEDLAADLGAPREQLYAALTVSDEVALKTEHPVQLMVCVGGCQEWGALGLVDHMLDIREQRSDDGAPNFDVVPRACLDRCAGAPALIARTEHGEATIAPATADAIDAAIQELFD